MNTSSVHLRPGGPADAEPVVTLTRARRRALADWEPTFWRPRANSDEAHAGFLRWCFGNSGFASPFVAIRKEAIVGFVTIPTRPGRLFFDDLCITEGEDWATVGPALLSAPLDGPSLLCAPTRDLALQEWLAVQTDWWPASYLFSIFVAPSEAPVPSESVAINLEIEDGPPHSFGPPIDPTLYGGLRITSEHGLVIGGVSVVPPIYDPGGATTVIDRVVGVNRGPLLSEALNAAARRGDVHVIVVADVKDTS